MIYIIHRKHVFDGGSRQSWNAVTAYSCVYRTGAKEMEWTKDFHYKKEAVAWCEENNIDWMTEEDWDNHWNNALQEAGDVGDIYFKAAQILNERLFKISRNCTEWKVGVFEGRVLGFKDGYKKGLAKGMSDGRFKMAKEIAVSMFGLGMPFETCKILFQGILSVEALSQIHQNVLSQEKTASFVKS